MKQIAFEDVRKGDRIRYEYRDPKTGRLTVIEDVAFYLGRTRESWVSPPPMKLVCGTMPGAVIYRID